MLSEKEVLKIFEYPKDRSEHWLIEEGSNKEKQNEKDFKKCYNCDPILQYPKKNDKK